MGSDGVKTGLFDRHFTAVLQMLTSELESRSLAPSPPDKDKEENGGH